MAAIPLATWLTIGSTAVTALGAISQGNTAAANYDAQANANRYNAEVDRQQSQTALNESAAAQQAKQRQRRQMLGTQRAGAAQSGVGIGGSNADLLEQSQTLSELDVLNLAYEGTMRSRGLQTQATMDEYQGRVASGNVGTSLRAGYLGAGKSLLVGASTIFGPKPKT